MPTALILWANAPVAAVAPLVVDVPVVVEAVLPVSRVPPSAGLDFLAFPQLCSDTLLRRLAAQRPVRRRRLFDPGGAVAVLLSGIMPFSSARGSPLESGLPSGPVVASGDGGSCSGIPLSPRHGQ